MSKKEKLKERLLSKPKNFTWDEVTTILSQSGYEQLKSTGTSARKFVDERNHIISIHKPHLGNIVKRYVLDILIKAIIDKDEYLKQKESLTNK